MLYGRPVPTSSIHDTLRTTPRMFLDRLPPNLVKLRLGCVDEWSTARRDMMALCSMGPGGQPEYCPRLEKVDLEMFEAPPESEYQCLVEAMAWRGVQVSLYVVRLEDMSRGMLPARPRDPKGILVPVRFGSATS